MVKANLKRHDVPAAATPPQLLRMFYKLKDSEIMAAFDVSHVVCGPHGFFPRDKIQVPGKNGSREATVIGVKDGCLWFHARGENGAEPWVKGGSGVPGSSEGNGGDGGIQSSADDGLFESGLWQGYYSRLGQRVPMSVNLEFHLEPGSEDGVITGEGSDMYGKYEIVGTYKPVLLRAEWKQQYANGKAVDFKGTREREGKGITGRWVAGNVQCNFHIGPIPKFHDPEQMKVEEGHPLYEVSKKFNREKANKDPILNKGLYPDKLLYLVKKNMTFQEFSVSRQDCEDFAFRPGEKIRTPLDGGREATVIGVREHTMWIHIDGEIGASRDVRKFRSKEDFENAGYTLLNVRRYYFPPPKRRRPPCPLLTCHLVMHSIMSFVWFFLEVFKQAVNFCWMLMAMSQLFGWNANQRAWQAEKAIFLMTTYLGRGLWLMLWYTCRAWSLFFSWVDAYQCPGSRSCFFLGWHTLILLCVVLIVRSDLMLLSGMSMLQMGRNKSRAAKVIARNWSKFVLGIYWFLLQSLMVFIRDGAFELFTWEYKPFTLHISWDGYCNQFDNFIFLFSRVLGAYIWILGVFMLSNLCALHDPAGWLLPLTMKSSFFLPVRCFYNLWMIIKLSLGMWGESEEASHRIAEMGKNFDNDNTDMDNKHEIICTTRSRQALLFWHAFPGGIMFAKFGECFVTAPAFVFSDRIALRESRYRRRLKAFGNLVKFTILAMCTFCDHWGYFLTFFYLLMWTIIISHVYEMAEEYADLACRSWGHPKIKTKYEQFVETEVRKIPRGPFYYIPPGCTKDADPFIVTNAENSNKRRLKKIFDMAKAPLMAQDPHAKNRGTGEVGMNDLMRKSPRSRFATPRE